MRKPVFYFSFEIKNEVPSLVRASVPAYLDSLWSFFHRIPDRKSCFFHKKNSLIGLLN